MARARRKSRSRGSSATDDAATAGGTGDFLGHMGLFETGNGLPFGPFEIALAFVAAVLIYPVTRFVGRLLRR